MNVAVHVQISQDAINIFSLSQQGCVTHELHKVQDPRCRDGQALEMANREGSTRQRQEHGGALGYYLKTHRQSKKEAPHGTALNETNAKLILLKIFANKAKSHLWALLAAHWGKGRNGMQHSPKNKDGRKANHTPGRANTPIPVPVPVVFLEEAAYCRLFRTLDFGNKLMGHSHIRTSRYIFAGWL